ncbi:hypothetical protein CEUSTIGMA_g1595.t1 [Chlamydomonas eustigma]|uniref:FAS1 domain-containing protein n=1 Tax=Chlamydomonas eustigma TaxID=1157962 RepID=A0A250WTR2_9CHLO|nr:hypothetical protein CEUSTIGMA_g1595.t1 [Chlamydomonas eustigma]|eukprot:GAX74146.1 hypothetical protein CEUSTIGMA_g1595.t1 [Chlamydomonas eustigma]
MKSSGSSCTTSRFPNLNSLLNSHHDLKNSSFILGLANISCSRQQVLTFFLPTDEAWTNLSNLTLDNITTSEAKAIMDHMTCRGLLTNIVPLNESTSLLDMTDGQQVLAERSTEAASSSVVTLSNVLGAAGDAQVLLPAIKAGHCLVYIVGGVLLPDEGAWSDSQDDVLMSSPADLMTVQSPAIGPDLAGLVDTPPSVLPSLSSVLTDANFTAMMSLMNTSNLLASIEETGQTTLFVASNEAWYEMLYQVNASGIPLFMNGQYINPIFEPLLQSLIQIHMVPAAVSSAYLTDGLVLSTDSSISSLLVDLKASPNNITIFLTSLPSSSARIITADIMASNNIIIHIIDRALDPIASK